MARTYFVKSARKAQGNCRVCGNPINIGDSYKWTKPRYRGKIAACPDCTIPLSMTSSSKMVAIWEAQAAFDEGEIESIPESLREFAGTVREVSEEYQESADNQRDYFPDSEMADENEELDLFQIISEVIGKATEEEREAIVEHFGLQKPIRKWMVERLADEFSRPNYNTDIHNDRAELLHMIKDEELNYYACLIVDKVTDEKRHNKAYWELYFWCREHNITNQEGFPHQALKHSEWNWRLELERTVKQIIKTARPDLTDEVPEDGESD